jgi:hypothetical protein
VDEKGTGRPCPSQSEGGPPFDKHIPSAVAPFRLHHVAQDKVTFRKGSGDDRLVPKGGRVGSEKGAPSRILRVSAASSHITSCSSESPLTSVECVIVFFDIRWVPEKDVTGTLF